MTERVPTRLRPDAEAVRPAPDGDPRAQASRAGVDRVDLGAYRPESHSIRPSAETPPMSGVPFGMCQTATTRCVAKLSTVIGSGSAIRDIERASRLG